MYHVPIMVDQILECLAVKKDAIYLDGTIGGGGHSLQILKQGGRVIGIDRDSDAIDECAKRLGEFGDRLTLKRENFKNVKAYLSDKLDGALLDLGISSHQIDTISRGMSYKFDAPLDMRMDKSQFLSAKTVINEYSEQELVRILFEYGEERFAKRIARAIVERRQVSPIETTKELADLVRKNIPNAYKEPHPEKRAFMAIRVEVNNELRGLECALDEIFGFLKKGARLCVISFHSLEDRIVKNLFNKLSEGCICDKNFPKCVCGHVAMGKIIGRFRATKEEIDANSRSKSATLRVIEKL